MKRHAALGIVLLAGVGACATSVRPSGLASGPTLAELALPHDLTEATYRDYREAYDALPVADARRPALRARLERYLAQRTRLNLRRGNNEGFESFAAAAQLYAPAEVYQGSVRDPLLYALAGEVVTAYRPAGDVRRVLPALAVQIGLDPAAKGPRREYQTVLRWLERTSDAEDTPGLRGWRSIRVMNRALEVWPSHLVVNTLCVMYVERLASLQRLSPHALLQQHPQLSFAALRATGYNIARALLWVDRPAEALARLRKVIISDRDDVLVHLLERVTAPKANAEAVLQLASAFEDSQPELALRICRRGTVRFPQAPMLYSCVGELAGRLENVTLSVAALEAAARLQPQSRAAAERLASEYQRQIFRLIENERLEQAQQRLQHIERFYREAAARLGKPLSPPLARVYYALGYGYYNAGRVEASQQALQRALEPHPLPEALVQLATIEVKLGHGAAARHYLDRAHALVTDRTPMGLYWRARIATLRAQSLALDGQHGTEQDAQRHAVARWRAWLRLDVVPEARAEALVHMAGCLFALGRQADAVDALEQAIDAAPDRKETYADVLAMLTARGHLPEALDAYHRALGRPEVTEYLKAYCSFWVINLARRAGLPPDPLAVRFVEHLDRHGHAWYQRLAPFVLGKATYASVRSHAKTPSQIAELSYYQAERLLAAGQIEQARKLWRRVVATRMLAFFEYDMAMYDLRNGPAKVSVQPVERASTAASGASDGDDDP